MPEQLDRKVVDIVRRLAGYLDANQYACDTAAGIARWWLRIDPEDTVYVQQALAWLKAHELIEELAAADGRLRYRRLGTSERFASVMAGLQ